jgi:cytoskeletal protein RodZ
MVKKFMTIVLAAMLTVNLCACSNNAGSDTTEATTATNTSEISTEVPSEEDTKASTEVTAETTNKSSEDASTTEADAAGSKAEVTTEVTTEKATEKATEAKTEAPRATTEATTEARTEAATEAKTEAPKATTEASCSHPKSARVAKYKTVHHDAEYKTEKVWVEKLVDITICNTCGKEIKGTVTEHDEASGTKEINIGTDENPQMVEVWNCNGSHGEWVDRGHYEKQKVKVKDAYDEKVVDYYYCGNCGKRL